MAAVRKRRILGSGQAAFTVSAMGFGCMDLNYHRSKHPDEAACIRLVHEAIERGVTLFDTAESYGPFTNEVLMGKALKGYTNRVCVTSKFGHKYVNGVQVKTEEYSSPANIRKVCENSLRSLGVEKLDMFYQHRGDPNTPIEVVAETIAELIKEGKILHWGLCEVNADTIRRAHVICPITAIQSEYHLMHRTVEESVLPLCRELGIGFVPYSPINRGFLGGLINEHTKFSPNDNRQTLPRFQPEAIRQNLRIVEVLNQFGRTRGYTPAQIDTLGGKENPPAASDGILARQNGADSLLVNYLPEMTHGVQRQNVNLRKTQKHKLLVLNTHQVSSNGLDVYLLLQSA